MTYPTFIEIDGKRVLWREIVQRRREQLKAVAKAVQAALFGLRDDTRPARERTAARRYLEPSLFTLLDGVSGGENARLNGAALGQSVVRVC